MKNKTGGCQVAENLPACGMAPIRVIEDLEFHYSTGAYNGVMVIYIMEWEFGTEWNRIAFAATKGNRAELISFDNITNRSGKCTGKQLNELFENVGI